MDKLSFPEISDEKKKAEKSWRNITFIYSGEAIFM